MSPVTNRYYRLRIRNSTDTADELVLTSVRGGTNVYLAGPPEGDGQSVDPLTGKVTTGEYSFEVIDAETGTNTRVLTSKLADANARQQLISRRAYGEVSINGTDWTPPNGSILVPGYITSIRLVDALTYDVGVGHTRRIEQSREIFNVATTNFGAVTAIVGGPIVSPVAGTWDVDNFAGVRDLGGWKVKATQINTTYDYVQLKLVQGFDPRGKYKGTFSKTNKAITNYTNKVASPFFEETNTRTAVGIYGWFPGLTVKVLDTSLNVVGYFTPLSDPSAIDEGVWYNPASKLYNFIEDGVSSFFVDWTDGVDASGNPVALPALNTEFFIYVYPKTIGKDNPIHVQGHPVDIWKALMDDAEIAYDATVLTAVKEEIGIRAKLTLRITQSYKLADFLQQVIFGPFGLGTRIVGGVQVLFTTRKKQSTTPAAVALSNLRNDEGTIFDLDESTVVTKVTLKQQILVPWNEKDEDNPEADALRATPKTYSIENSNDDTPATGEREVSYDIPGMIGRIPDNPEYFIRVLGEEIFDVYGRGAIECETQCFDSVTAQIGDMRVLTLKHLPGATIGATPVSKRETSRLMRCVSRTETPEGPDLKWIDWGAGTAAFATAPTFTIAVNAADNRFVTITLTNAGAMIAAGVKVRVDIAIQTLAPTAGQRGATVGVWDPNVTTSGTFGPYDLGAKVWAQMRTEKVNQLAGAYTAWASAQLITLDPPTGLTVSAENATDVTRRTISWTNGANATNTPIEVRMRITADAVATEQVIALLVPGTTSYEITGLSAGTRTVSVRHREAPPAQGISASASVSVVSTGAGTILAPPTNPVAFSISGAPIGNPNYALEVVAGVFPSSVQIEQKLSLTGTWALVATVASVASPTVTRWENYVAYDGQTRYLRARHTLSGYEPSEYTAEVSVIPGNPAGTGAALALNDLTDVVITASATGDLLRFDGTNWVDVAGIPATDLTSATVPTARLGSGTASATTFLRGDQTWATPSGGGTGAAVLPLDIAPGTAHAKDDDFPGTTLDAKWTNPITSSRTNTLTVLDNWLSFEPSETGTLSTGHKGAWGVRQTAPTGSFTITAKIADIGTLGDDARSGIFVARTASSVAHLVGIQRGNARQADVEDYTYSESANWVNLAYAVSQPQLISPVSWFKIVWDSGAGSLTFYYADSGVRWRLLATRTGQSQPDRIGIALCAYGLADTTADHVVGCDWFRVTEP